MRFNSTLNQNELECFRRLLVSSCATNIEAPLQLELAPSVSCLSHVTPPFNWLYTTFYDLPVAPFPPTSSEVFSLSRNSSQTRPRLPPKPFLVTIWTMSDSQERQPWSNNPYAPKIPDVLHLEEKANFAGVLIASMLYGAPKTPRSSIRAQSFHWYVLGIIIVLFFQCMTGLFDSTHRRGERVKWGLGSYTTIIFSLVTILTAMNLHIQSIAYIDNREFRGNEGALFSGPLGYQVFISPEAISIIPSVSFTLSNWLADGLLVSSQSDATFTHSGN